MGLRRKSRECALQLLFAQEHAPMPADGLPVFWDSVNAPESVRPYAIQLAEGVLDKRAELDDVIRRYAENWTVERMSRVDRNLLRLAVYELFYVPDVPVRVTLDEAVEIARAFGGDESSRFVNGILDRITREETERLVDNEGVAPGGLPKASAS